MSKRYEWVNGETYCDSDQMYDNETGNKTQPVYVADLLNQQDAKIKELEDMVIDKQNKLYSRLDKIKELQEENQQLKQQLADALKDFNDIQEENDKLAQQLAEKDELLRQKIGKMKSTDFIRMCKECGFMVQTKEIDNQTAIEELEKAKENIKNSPITDYDQNEHFIKMYKKDAIEIIDQQIKSLKGENK